MELNKPDPGPETEYGFKNTAGPVPPLKGEPSGSNDPNALSSASSTFAPANPPFEHAPTSFRVRQFDGNVKRDSAEEGASAATRSDRPLSRKRRSGESLTTGLAGESEDSAAESTGPGKDDTALDTRDPAQVTPRLSTDRPTDVDLLGFRVYAKAIAQFLLDDESKPPLTISIQAPWGGGKTSMMLMIEDELDPKDKRNREPADEHLNRKLSVKDLEFELEGQLTGKSEPELPEIDARGDGTRGRTTVWFNAWKYESTNQVWAGLVDAILQQVPTRLPRWKRELFWLRLNLSRVDSARIRQSLHELFINRALLSSAGLGGSILAAAVVFTSSAAGLHYGLSSAPPTTLGASSLLAVVLGVISKWIAATFEFKKEAAGEMFKSIVRAPSYDTELGFVHQAESDLRRVFRALPENEGLVIFIDDLDRCSPTKVAAVLEAVNLIIAGDFPDCYFVVGMDAEMVAAALQVAHKDLTANAPNDARIPIGWRFMDKFVQLPFIVPPLVGGREKSLLHRLWGRPDEDQTGISSNEEEQQEGQPRQRDIRDVREFVQLSESLSYLFQGNPRELKRFTNLLRFHWYLWHERSIDKSEPRTLSVFAEELAHWTALSIKWPEHARWLRRLDSRQAALRTLESVPELPDEAAKAVLAPLQTLCVESSLNHLKILETLATADAVSFKVWRTTLKLLYDMDDKATMWLNDGTLFDFYKLMVKGGTALSSQTGRGFW
ncbi:KAP family P-loop NTPase fold protein [Paraburkholderia sp. MM5477-R1]|uniref:KAP family P-loop NTPase fold protein n=1 Tax=Paraburkholderia sp. MM5477-R1 TaxID=2991062 RepID=UPI003D1C0FD4